jgi:hypothetical protein
VNRKLYIHELIDIIGHNRARYMHHMTANWVPVARRERHMNCFGVRATVGSTGAWPQVVNLWELNGWKGLAANFEHELVGRGAQDPSLAEWWSIASELRAGGFDRIVAPERWNPTIDELTKAGVKGAVYAHEIVRAPIGGARAFLDALAETGRPAVEELGLQCIGAFRVMMATDSEAYVIWEMPELATGAADVRACARGALAVWRHRLVALGVDVHRTLMVDAPLSPMRIGRQPTVEDRLPLAEIGP